MKIKKTVKPERTRVSTSLWGKVTIQYPLGGAAHANLSTGLLSIMACGFWLTCSSKWEMLYSLGSPGAAMGDNAVQRTTLCSAMPDTKSNRANTKWEDPDLGLLSWHFHCNTLKTLALSTSAPWKSQGQIERKVHRTNYFPYNLFMQEWEIKSILNKML